MMDENMPGGWYFVEVVSEGQALSLAATLQRDGYTVRPPYQDEKQLPASRASWWIVDYR